MAAAPARLHFLPLSLDITRLHIAASCLALLPLPLPVYCTRFGAIIAVAPQPGLRQSISTTGQPHQAAIETAAPAVHAAGAALLPPPLLIPTQTGHDPPHPATVPAARVEAARECIVAHPLGSKVGRHLSAAVSLG